MSNFLNSFNLGFRFGILGSNPLLCGFMNNFSFNPFMTFFSQYNTLFSSISPIFYQMPSFYNTNISIFDDNTSNYTHTGIKSDSNNYNSVIDLFDDKTFWNRVSKQTINLTPWQTYTYSSKTGSNTPSLSSNNNSSSSYINQGNRTLQQKHWTELTDSEMKSVYGDYSRDIRTLYTGTAEQLNRYLSDKGFLKGCGQAFLDAQRKYGISASVLIGICMYESAKGTVLAAKNNFFGIRKFHSDGTWEWRKFESKSECIDFVANQLKTKYITPPEKGKVTSLTKLYQINGRYCPAKETPKNANWAKRVSQYADEAERA